MCGCDYCNKRGIPEPDCCPKCDSFLAQREQDIRPYRSVTIDGQRLIEYGPVLRPANPHTRFTEANDFTAGGTA